MPTKIKLGTFNVENLFLRYRLLDKEKGNRFGKAIDKNAFLKGGGSVLMLGTRIEDYGPVSKSLRNLTAKLILTNKPDILAMQEVENLEALKRFNQYFLKNQYPYMLVIDANDPRQIDVGILSKFPIKGATTHQFEPPRSPITKRTFSRDCLEVDVQIAKKKTLTVLVNHFKSKIGGGEEKRKRQAQRVMAIARERFGKDLRGGDFVIAGDLNAHWTAAELSSLMKNPHLTNAVRDLVPDAEEHWTHYYAKGKSAEALDHLLLSPTLAAKNKNARVTIERRGLGKDISYYTGERFTGLTGKEGASDHCAIFIELKI